MLIVISSPVYFEGEAQAILNLFHCGLEYFHLRKPGFSLEKMDSFLSELNDVHLSKIVIHDHFELLHKYPLKGIHYNKTNSPLESFEPAFSKSSSCHSIPELKQINPCFDYTFLSPVFDSISKSGYGPGFNLEFLKSEILDSQLSKKTKIVALGGINSERIAQLPENIFHGVAVLGAVWEGIIGADQEKIIQESEIRFREIRAAYWHHFKTPALC